MSIYICIANFMPWEGRQWLTLFFVWFIDLSHFTKDWFVCRQGVGLDIRFELLALVHKWSTACLQADTEKWEKNCITKDLLRCLWGSSVCKDLHRETLFVCVDQKREMIQGGCKMGSLNQMEIIDCIKRYALHGFSVSIRLIWSW